MQQLPKKPSLLFPISPPSNNPPEASKDESSSPFDQKSPNLADAYKCKIKRRKVIRKRVGLLQRAVAQTLAPSHVFNFLGLVGINQRTLRDPNYEESYYRSMFYIRQVEKTQLRKNALLIFTKSAGSAVPTPYLTERLRSFGDNSLYQLALALQEAHRLYFGVDFRRDLLGSCESQPLARLIEGMQDRIYMCKIAPNRILISRKLLEFLGEDPELYGVRICKYGTPLEEIISGEQYSAVIAKTVQNVGLLCAFLQGRLSLEELQQWAKMEFDDYLYAKDKMMFCRFALTMPSPLISCLEVQQQLGPLIDTARQDRWDRSLRRNMQQQVTEHSYKQTAVLRYLIDLPANLLSDYRARTAGYIALST